MNRLLIPSNPFPYHTMCQSTPMHCLTYHARHKGSHLCQGFRQEQCRLEIMTLLSPLYSFPTLASPPSPDAAVFAFALSNSFPHGNCLPSVPLAAFSHSSSVGSLFPSHLQYASASAHLIFTAGWFSLSKGITWSF